jgi:hypothetical protein
LSCSRSARRSSRSRRQVPPLSAFERAVVTGKPIRLPLET